MVKRLGHARAEARNLLLDLLDPLVQRRQRPHTVLPSALRMLEYTW